MTGNGLYIHYIPHKNGDDWGMVYTLHMGTSIFRNIRMWLAQVSVDQEMKSARILNWLELTRTCINVWSFTMRRQLKKTRIPFSSSYFQWSDQVFFKFLMLKSSFESLQNGAESRSSSLWTSKRSVRSLSLNSERPSSDAGDPRGNSWGFRGSAPFISILF